MEVLIVRRLMVVKIAILAVAVASTVASQLAKLGCNSTCGNLEIPYPFGMNEGCYLDEKFFVECNKTHYDPPKAFLMGSNIEVTNISLNGELQILQYVARDCYTQDGPDYSNIPSLTVPMFTISNTKNKFTVIGCDTYAYIYGQLEGENYTSGCMGWCVNNPETVREGLCSGNGCCQLEIPKGLKDLRLEVYSFKNHTKVLDFNPCGYAFVIQQDKFTFSDSYFLKFPEEKVPLVLDWGIKNDTCLIANNTDNCLCGPYSKKNNTSLSMDESEYYCQCLDGFEGNPYLGCQNIDECERKVHDCLSIDHCKDTNGSYTCYCPDGYGDGKLHGTGCTSNSMSPVLMIVGIGVGSTVMLIGSTWKYLDYKRLKFNQRKKTFFENNGGSLLQQHPFEGQSSTDAVRIFTQEELKNAIKKFDKSAAVGKSGYGTVYKGVFEDGLVVAIKELKSFDQSQTSQFINEVIVLSKINHRNVAKLIGCCLETKVPLLVYEFIPNGNGKLYDHIHDKTKRASLSWEARLKIASQTADALSYLHSSCSTPIIHGDIMSTNIFLDHNYTVKVSDFRASKLVPLDKTQLSKMVRRTLGYLDPEYLLTSKLTEKSDVYSLGIVLLELITGKEAMRFDGPEVERNLAMYALCTMKEDRVEEIVEKGMATKGNLQQIKEVAKLAKECLRVRGEERPTMREVAMKLEELRQMKIEHSFIGQ